MSLRAVCELGMLDSKSSILRSESLYVALQAHQDTPLVDNLGLELQVTMSSEYSLC